LCTARTYVIPFLLLWVVMAIAVSPEPPPIPCFSPLAPASAASFCRYLLSLVQSRLCCQDCSRSPGGHSPNGRALPVGWAYYLFATRPPLRAVAVVVETAVGVMLVFAVTKLLFSAGGYVAIQNSLEQVVMRPQVCTAGAERRCAPAALVWRFWAAAHLHR
jgi:hypothetical protein